MRTSKIKLLIVSTGFILLSSLLSSCNAGTTTSSSQNVNSTPVGSPFNEFLYVASISGSIAMYNIDRDTGMLHSLGTQVSITKELGGIAVDPSGKYAYTVGGIDLGQGLIVGYSINPNGQLSPLMGPPIPIPGGVGIGQISFSPSGKYVYTVGNGYIDVCSMDPTTGELTLKQTLSVPIDFNFAPLVFTPSGNYAYVTNIQDYSNGVFMYSVNESGELTSLPSSPIAAGSIPYGIAIDPLGRYAYVANNGDNTVSMYSISESGMLVSLGTAISAGSEPWNIVVDKSGQYVYVTNSGDSSISMYVIGKGGVLTPIGSVASGENPVGITFDPAGPYVYVTNYNFNPTISMYEMNSENGSLKPINVTESPVTTVFSPIGMAVN